MSAPRRVYFTDGPAGEKGHAVLESYSSARSPGLSTSSSPFPHAKCVHVEWGWGVGIWETFNGSFHQPLPAPAEAPGVGFRPWISFLSQLAGLGVSSQLPGRRAVTQSSAALCPRGA